MMNGYASGCVFVKRVSVILISTFLVCTAAIAQPENSYNGKWIATWQGTKGQHRNEANVVIQGNGGTFQNLHGSSRNPCVGLKAPIVIKTVAADELVFVIEFSTVLKGCGDSKVTLKRADEKTLKGFRDEDKAITLIKE